MYKSTGPTALVAALITIFPLLSPDAPAQAQAQTWPQRPVKFIVPFGPGAGADIGARLLADRLTMHWGKGVVVENRPAPTVWSRSRRS